MLKPIPTLLTMGLPAALLSAAVAPVRLVNQPATKQKPNIIRILSEDISTNLACYGIPVVKTPVLDQFAQESRLKTKTGVQRPGHRKQNSERNPM